MYVAGALATRRLLVLTLAATSLTVGGAAWAARIQGSDQAERLVGTPGPDSIFGHGGNDEILGLGGNDLLDGGPGRDRLSGGAGSDRIWAAEDGARDAVACGGGHDLVAAELTDEVSPDCETVVRQLSRDTLVAPGAQSQTQVEPASDSVGRTIVTAFQSDRYFDGGSGTIGFARSTDAGETWRSGFLPGLTIYSSPPGTNLVATDSSVAYDAAHREWLVVNIGAGEDLWGIYVSRSRDGIRWSLPVAAITGPPESFDKDWVTCDSWETSRFRGRCYVSYLDGDSGKIATITSSDGGLTWSPPALPPGTVEPGVVNGAQPLVRPDGTLVVLYASTYSPSVLDDEMVA
ncbi:MAG: hypothetical protein C5B48_15965, partial [Candidatus Rokuibacteriota bacterium]